MLLERAKAASDIVAEAAAREAKFSPTRLNGEPVMVRGILVYNFVAQ
jgi:hypothetical protein